MLSFGTEDFFALTIASYSVGLPTGSPPPVRAATSTFLINLAKSLPRRASTTAFLCLVVAHLEWPDMCVSCSISAVWRGVGPAANDGPDRRTRHGRGGRRSALDGTMSRG